MGEPLQRFVRDTLDCTCPDEVFEHVETRENVILGKVVLKRRIDVGNRLLIYVLESDDPRFIAQHLPEVFVRGRDERDRYGFNRLRVVVAADKPQWVAAAAQGIYQRAREKDERIHLHLVNTAATCQL